MNLKETIKKIIPKNIKKEIIRKREERYCKEKQIEIKVKRNEKPLIFLLATPNHGNIGDQAIAIAEMEFLHNELSDFNVIEISFNEYLFSKSVISNWIKDDDTICYHGGGNMGIQYFECEEVFRDIIKRFPNNKIVSFPQTIYYGNSDKGINEFEESKKIYNAHSHLTLTARETVSYEIMKNAYTNCDIILTPDIVLYHTEKKGSVRNGALTCLRSDVEKTLKDADQKYIFGKLEKEFPFIKKSDTIVSKEYIATQERENVFENKLQEFRDAEVVVSDRLHGMVFAYLTQTPCVIFSNYNYKVAGVYEWIKENDFIKFVKNIDEFDNALSFVLNSSQYKEFDHTLFEPLKNAINLK